MDVSFRAFVGESADGTPNNFFLDYQAEEIRLDESENSPAYHLKPLDQLYGPGRDASRFSTEDEQYERLLYSVESPIYEFYRMQPALTDGQVLLSLRQLAMNPAAPVASDSLATRVQVSIRLVCSMDDFNRGEVRAAIKKVIQSVERHTASDGRRGYLTFLEEYMV